MSVALIENGLALGGLLCRRSKSHHIMYTEGVFNTIEIQGPLNDTRKLRLVEAQ